MFQLLTLPLAHVIRNRMAKVYQAAHALKGKHRWCLTGTPIQNRVEDLGALIAFLRVKPFDSVSTFQRTFVDPVNHGDRRGWERLKALVVATSLRSTKEAIEEDLQLPARSETVQDVRLDAQDRQLYSSIKRYCVRAIESKGAVMSCFQMILRLRQICNHGRDLLPQSLRDWLDQGMQINSNTDTTATFCEQCNSEINDVDSVVLDCLHQICASCRRSSPSVDEQKRTSCPLCSNDPDAAKAEDRRREYEPRPYLAGPYRPSAKVKALLKRLNASRLESISSGEPCTKR